MSPIFPTTTAPVAWDDAGFIYFADKALKRVFKCEPSGAYIASWGEDGDGPGQFKSPVSLAFDGQNYLYTLDSELKRVSVHTKDGKWLSVGAIEQRFYAELVEKLGLADAGLPSVLSQTFRTLLKSRMQVGLDKYQVQYENTDLVLFEPNADDAEMFFTNIFSYHSRQRLTEHAYRATLDDLRERRDEIEPILLRNGIRLRDEIVNDRQRSLLARIKAEETQGQLTAIVGGAHDGESILDVYGYNGEARGILHDPPIDLSDITGLRFGCEFENPRDVPVLAATRKGRSSGRSEISSSG